MTDADFLDDYFRVGRPFWEFAVNQSVLVVSDDFAHSSAGQTIAFTAEVKAVAERLAADGLPPFHSIVAYLCCFKDKQVLLDLIDHYFTEREQRGTLKSIIHNIRLELEPSPVEVLNRVPEKLRNTLEFKVELAQHVLNDSNSWISPETSRAICDRMQHGIGKAIATYDAEMPWPREMLTRLLTKISKVDYRQIALTSETGLPLLPKPIESQDVDDPDPVDPRDFLKSIKGRSELAGMSAIAEQLLAAVSLPKQLSDQSQIEFGGFSDITNRGTPDRLLISELANDDLTLAVRVAMNEAMYLRRESPPRVHVQQRLILLHNGVRSWGLPRVFAASAALAFAASSDSNHQLIALRSEGTVCDEFELLSEPGLTDHLKSFSFELHPGPSFAAFTDHFQSLEHPTEPILILEESEFNDPEFQQTLLQSDISGFVVATVNRDGGFHLFLWNASGVKTIRRAKLDLQEILSKQAAKQLSKASELKSQPAILGVSRFPLRLSHSLTQTFCLTHEGLLVVTQDHRLMLWNIAVTQCHRGKRLVRGGIQLADNLPKGSREFLVDSFTNSTILVCQNEAGISLILFESQHKPLVTTRLSNVQGVRSFMYYRGVFATVTRGFFIVFDVYSGQSLQAVRYVGEVTCGRFVWNTDKSQWQVATPSENGLKLEPITFQGKNLPKNNIIAFLSSPSRSGYLAIRSDGTMIETDGWKVLKLSREPLVEWRESKDHQRMAFRTTHQCHRLVDAAKEKDFFSEGYGELMGASEKTKKYFFEAPLRNRFVAVEISQDKQFVLVSRKHEKFLMALQNDQITLKPIASDNYVERGESRREFSDVELDLGYRLRAARWQSVNESDLVETVFLDSRGLLHLQSGDLSETAIPELTLVLKDGQLSGWLSTGEVFGNPYYHHDESIKISPVEAFRRCVKPFVERICDQL